MFCKGDEVAAVLGERFVGCFWVVGGDALVAADLLHRPPEVFSCQAKGFKDFSRFGLVALFEYGQDDMLDGDVFVAELGGLFLRVGVDVCECMGELHAAGLNRCCAAAFDRGAFL